MRWVLAWLWCMACLCGQDMYQGWAGRWVTVVATAYSPLDGFTRDDQNNPRRLTATGVSTLGRPYGIAVDPRAIPFGTRLVIPAGNGYLDRLYPDDRLFIADDTGPLITNATRDTGVVHIDLRYIGVDDALRFGVRRFRVFIITDAQP
jgi:3D (Asp-Asp-Asp) domain-containing protein